LRDFDERTRVEYRKERRGARGVENDGQQYAVRVYEEKVPI